MKFVKTRIFLLSIILLTVSDSYSQNEPKISLWLGYYGYNPLDSYSDMFKNKSKRQKTEIQWGNGISSTVFIYSGKIFRPYVRTGYTWHQKLRIDTLILGNSYSKNIKYSSIPISIGTNLDFYKGFGWGFGAHFEFNYNIITRYSSVPDLNQNNKDIFNNYGYEIGINFFGVHHRWYESTISMGISTKGKFKFIYYSFSFPILPISYYWK